MQTSLGKRETFAAPFFPFPLWAAASTSASQVTESTAVPMWVVSRPGQTSWIRMLRAPSRAEVGCLPPWGWTVSSVSERTVVYETSPGVSSGWALIASSRLE